MWIPAQTTRPPFATARNACGTSAPTGAKMIAASSSTGGDWSEPLAHMQPSVRERLRTRIARPRQGINLPPLRPRDLRDDVGSRAEPIEPEAIARPRHAERPIADQAGAKQRCRLDVAEARRNRQAISRVGDDVRGIATIAGGAGEHGPVAQVLASGLAIAAYPAGLSEPRHTEAVTELRRRYAGTDRDDAADNFMPRNDGVSRIDFAIDHMQIGSANTAREYLQHDLSGSRPRHRTIDAAKCLADAVELHGITRVPLSGIRCHSPKLHT